MKELLLLLVCCEMAREFPRREARSEVKTLVIMNCLECSLSNVTLLTWDDVAEQCNMQSHPDVISKMNKFWGFKS